MIETRGSSPYAFVLPTLMVLGALLCCDARGTGVVINEIMSNPDVKTELVEYVELHNTGGHAIDLSGWHFSNGILYAFDKGTILPAGGYIIVSQSPSDIRTKWGMGRPGVPESVVFGPYAGKLNNEGERITLANADGQVVDEVDYKLGFPWPTIGDPVREGLPGTGRSMQLVNPLLDNDLAGSWRSGVPTPARENSDVFADNIPPHIRQVKHLPEQPKSGQAVTISAKVTDPDGVARVDLLFQVVVPGSYVRLTDRAYSAQWTAVPMYDDGLYPDLQAADHVYTANLPELMQLHRHLVRYRIEVADSLGSSLVVPYADDPQPNFAYFVYDGVPAWRAAIKPGNRGPLGQVIEYPEEVMRQVPAYHLISLETDVLDCQYNSAYRDSGYRFQAALVYDGRVYDHIGYRVRGQNSTYVSGKNKWKLRFNRGHFFQGRDDYGRPYKTGIKTLNFSALSAPWAPQNRGMAGMDEALAFRLFNMAGVPAYNTTWFQLRVIDAPAEADPADQYEGDLWGLYLAFENPNNQFLEEHDLPDGNLYKMQGSHRYLNQGPTQPTDKSDLTSFISAGAGYNKANPIQPLVWWQRHVNLDAYYSYRAVVEVINHSDLRDRENSVYYHNPETDQWWMLPWDLDLLYEEFARWGPVGIQSHSTLEQFRKVLRHPQAMIAFQNRARELQDLLFNRDQLWQLIDELAAVVADPNLPYSMADVDRAMWDSHPRTRTRFGSSSGIFYRTPFPGQDIYNGFYNYERVLPSADFAGMVRYIKDFVVPPGHGGSLLNDLLSDRAIPDRPVATYTGRAGYPGNDLTFVTYEFTDPQGSHTFAARQWRIGEVEDTTPSAGLQRGNYEIEAIWESEEMTNPRATTVTIPASVVEPGRTYRVRCRAKDDTGRWSRWSEPVQFIATEPVLQGLAADLRITELMYNPEDSQDGANNDNYEFIELKNIGDITLDLTHVSFADGIVFDFNGSAVTHIGPGQFVLVVSNIAAFESRYGPALSAIVAGEYSGRFANGGEHVELVDYWDGTIAKFEYDDGGNWPGLADGAGHSLVPLDSALAVQSDGPLSNAANWRASTYPGGSPGTDDP